MIWQSSNSNSEYLYGFTPKIHLPIYSQCTPSLPPKNLREPQGFLMFLGGGERMYWEQMGLNSSPKSYVTVKKLFISEKTQQRFSVG